MRALKRTHIREEKLKIGFVRAKLDHSLRAKKIGPRRAQLRFGFLLRVMLRSDALAEITRMIAIESLRDGLVQWHPLRVLDDHRAPGKRLKHEGPAAHGEAQSGDDCQADNHPKHKEQSGRPPD